jgi:4-amino-4-deoxy-L-arabinose transferase-like glycosyltransferase
MNLRMPGRTIRSSRASDVRIHNRQTYVPHALAGILIVYVALAVIQSLTLPVFEGPDEQHHYAYARYLVNHLALPPMSAQPNDDSSTYQVRQEAGQPPLYYILIALVTAPFPGADDVQGYVNANPYMTAYDVTGVSNDNHNRYLHGQERYAPFTGLSLAIHVGRLVSVMLGTLTLLGVYGAARAVAPARPALALLATALTACQPVFIFLNSAITNDSAVICFTTLTLWIALRILREGPTLKLSILGGLFAGLTVLSKFNGIWIAPVVWLVILAAAWLIHQRGRLPIGMLAASIGVWLLVVGWWFVRNMLVGGDPFGLTIHAIGDQSPLHVAKSAVDDFGLHLANLESSAWFFSGWAGLVPAPTWIVTLFRLSFGIGWLGALGAGVQTIRRKDRLHLLQGLCLVLCLALAIAGAIYWILIYMWTLGRLILPAIGAAAVLSACGWGWLYQQVKQMQLRMWLPRLVSPLLGVALLSGGIGSIYTTSVALNMHPSITPASAQMTPTQITFLSPDSTHTPVAEIIGYEFVAQDVRAGGALYGKICWKSLGYTVASYPYSLQLVGEGDARPGTRSSYHGLGSYPMSAWRPGEEFCDPTSLRVEGAVDRPRALNVLVSLFDLSAGQSPTSSVLTAVDAGGTTIYPIIARVRVAPAHQAAPPAPTTLLGDFAGLTGSRLEMLPQADGTTTLSVTLQLAALKSTPVDAKVFMHVIDPSGALIAQSDHQPDAGWFPTNYWQKGDVINDHFEISLPAGAQVNSLKFGLGMYDGQSGQRLTAIDAGTGARAQDDMFFLNP